MSRRGEHRRVVAPTTRLGESQQGDLTPPATAGWRPTEPGLVDPAQPGDVDPAAQPQRAPRHRPAVPARASEDTDEAWGELPEGSDDPRHLREKPPHWQ